MLNKLRTLLGGATSNDAAAIALIDEGNALEEAGQTDAAMARYDAALALAPALPRAHLNRGNVLLARGDAAAALQACDTALGHAPDYVGGHFNRGNALLALGRPDAALAAYRRVLALDPGFVDAHVASGAVLDDLGRPVEAIEAYRAALALRPGHAPVLSNLGGALKAAGRFIEAIEAQRAALAIDPGLAQAHDNLGSALKDIGALDEAEASYRRAIALKPGDFGARSNLLFSHNFRASQPPAVLREEADAFGRVAAGSARPFTHWLGSAQTNRPLRVGLVSGDLRAHPVGFFIESVVAALAAQSAPRLRLVAYVTAHCDDRVAERIRAGCAEWHAVQGQGDEALAARIHADAIDILIDLSGHTAHNRLPVFAWKPSPVQVSWLGYFATTGVAAIDHLIADATTLPEDQATRFSERIWRLPETRLCFSAPEPSPEVGALPGLRAGHFTFGCFNQLSKLGDPVVALWARVLEAVPGSRLLLKSPPLQEPALRDALRLAFGRHGIPADRLAMEGISSRADYLARYGAVDIALDPFPFTGGTTSAEALWMGVPVLTLAGASFLSRQGVGMLTVLDLPEWIAADADAYVRIAVEQAGDPARLAALRGSLRQRMRASPLMDAPRFARHLDAALLGMWDQWVRQRG